MIQILHCYYSSTSLSSLRLNLSTSHGFHSSFKRDQTPPCWTTFTASDKLACHLPGIGRVFAHLHSPGRRSGMTARTLAWAAGRSWRWCTSSEERFLASARRAGSSAQIGIATTTADITTWTRTSRTCVSGVRRSNRKQITRMSLQYSTSSSGVNFREEFGVTSLVLFGPTADKRRGRGRHQPETNKVRWLLLR